MDNILDPKRPWVHIDKFRRYQVALSVENLFPNLKNGLCGCGCGKELTKAKKRWATPECQNYAYNYFLIIKGDHKAIRNAVLKRDNKVCRMCGLISDSWQADHIIPVHKGGGACTIDNFQSLCEDCHKEKTKADLAPPPHIVG
jgi:5-methylcytosine-specific restriction endonuclease McrA